MPHVASWEELNEHLREQCVRRLQQKLWGHTKTIAERSERDREKLLPLPVAPLEACQQRTTRASSQALVRCETNDYSVPVEYGHRQVLVKAFVWEMVISACSDVIGRHSRSYGREEMIINPLHYLALLEQKTNALDQAAPPEGWQLPEEFGELRRQTDGSPAGQTRPAGIRAGAAAAGDLFIVLRSAAQPTPMKRESPICPASTSLQSWRPER